MKFSINPSPLRHNQYKVSQLPYGTIVCFADPRSFSDEVMMVIYAPDKQFGHKGLLSLETPSLTWIGFDHLVVPVPVGTTVSLTQEEVK